MLNFTLSSRAYIAVAAMVNLERCAHESPLALPQLCAHLDISLSSVEQVFGPLRRGGLVQSLRGPGGGYQLARAARDISIADIVAAVDKAPKAGTSTSKLQGSWPLLSRAMTRCLAAVSLQDLVDDEPGAGLGDPCDDAGHALRRGISTRPVLEPVRIPSHANSVFALAEALIDAD